MVESLFTLPEEEPAAKERKGGQPRLEKPERQQIKMHLASLDELLPEDHRVRLVWEMVQGYDLEPLYARIRAVEGWAGRPAIEPKVLVGMWLYATLEGVGSARELGRLCEESLPYQWLLGGITVNYHTLSDFRVESGQALENILTKSVAALISEGVISVEKTAQDGIRIRASAGASSFRRKPTLEESLKQAQGVMDQLKVQEEEKQDEGERSAGQKAAQERQATEKLVRVKKALEEVEKVAAKLAKRRDLKVKNRAARASTTDPEARVMKMPDGGFRPAYNGQFSIDMDSGVIVGVQANNEADTNLLNPMLDQIEKRCQRFPKEHYVDGGYRNNASFEKATEKGVSLYCPIPKSYSAKSQKRPEDILPTDGSGVRAWKERMITPQAKEKYKQRAATIEWANALARNRGLYRLLVRGLRKVEAILLWYALAHNLVQVRNLRAKMIS